MTLRTKNPLGPVMGTYTYVIDGDTLAFDGCWRRGLRGKLVFADG